MILERGVVRQIQRFRPTLFSLLLELPGIASRARPGQFIHLRISNAPGILLRRPFSIAGVEGDSLLKLIVKIVGSGTAKLAYVAEGSACDAIGPLGKGFDWSGADSAFLLGGGIGDAPLLFLQDELVKLGVRNCFFLGARTLDEFPLEDGIVADRSIIPCTDDGSFGEKGFVSSVFEKYLKASDSEGARVFSCGPVAMMKEVARICALKGLPHRVSLENRMGCGVGVCQGCALRLKDDEERGGFRLICHDGPVFDAAEIDWSLIY